MSNHITVKGNLGKEPELRYTPQGTAVCSGSIASKQSRSVKGVRTEYTQWFNYTIWGTRAETFSKYMTVGSSPTLFGEFHNEEWTDREGGARTTAHITVSDFWFGDARQTEEKGDAYEPPTYNETAPPVATPSDDDIPF